MAIGAGSLKKQFWIIAGCIIAITIGFASYTDHRWEDWYITYRASKNLAIGNGLVFTVGQKIHSFTSPIGTLVPSLLNFITFNKSDELVIWLFRIVNAVLLGISGIILFKISSAKKFTNYTTLLLLGLFSTNILIIDFSINGMETAFMMLCLSYYFSILLIPQQHLVGKLAITFAALMYTRPDGFVYGGCIALGFFIFQYKINDAIKTRTDFIKIFAKAIGLAVLVYLPWLIITAIYYGSPIPHTIVAKSVQKHYSVNYVFNSLIRFARELLLLKGSSSEAFFIFLPPYAAMGWEKWATLVNRIIGVIAAFAFLYLYKTKRAEIKAISFAVFLIGFYLAKISGQAAMPWYIPNLALPVILLLCLLYQSLSESKFGATKPKLLLAILLSAMAFNLYIFINGAIELKYQQQIIETGNRKEIGLWLKENAAPSDNVFLEYLGYIGFYSNLKTYDYPGMSSPEVVEVTKRTKSDKFATVIDELKPIWLVLRPNEIVNMRNDMPGLLENNYTEVKIFDVTDKIPGNLPGRNYLLYDSKFTIFKIKGK